MLPASCLNREKEKALAETLFKVYTLSIGFSLLLSFSLPLSLLARLLIRDSGQLANLQKVN